MEDNLYLAVVKPIYNKMLPEDYLYLAEKCHEIEKRIEKIKARP